MSNNPGSAQDSISAPVLWGLVNGLRGQVEMACSNGNIHISVGTSELDEPRNGTEFLIRTKLDNTMTNRWAQIYRTNNFEFEAGYSAPQLHSAYNYLIEFSAEGQKRIIRIPLKDATVSNYLRQCTLENSGRFEQEDRQRQQQLFAGDEAWNRLMSCPTRNLVALCQGTVGRTALHFYGNALLQNNVPNEKITEVRNRVRTICGLMQSSGVNTSDLDGGGACQSR